MSTVIKKYFLQSLTFAFIAALLLTSFDALANKVKIKRDFIYIDKKKTPLKVEKDDTDTYIFTDTSSGKVFVTASYLFERVDDENSFQWLVLKTDGSSYANEVDLEYISFTLSVKKAVTEFLMKRLGFFDAKGVVNQSKLDEYFSQQRVRASQQKQIAAAADLAEQEAQFQKTASLGIAVDADAKKIFRKSDESAKLPEGLIGAYRFSDAKTLVLRDLDDVKIATVTQNPFDEVKVDSQFLNEPMLYESKNNFSPGSLYGTREFVVELVRHLHTRDIRMGHQAQEILAQYKAGVKAEARINYEAAKANSSNLYEQEGYAIDYKGERYDGKITVMFEELDVYDPDDPFSGPNIIDLSGDGEGAKIRIDYLNSKQKMKRKTLSAKKNNRFCVYVAEGQESCYQGLQIKSNGLLAAAGNDALEISVNQGNKFMREVSVNGTLSVYQEPASKAFFIKSSKQKKAFNFKFGPLVKEKRKASKLKDYLGGCDYSDGNYNENALRFDLNEVQALVDFYNQNCK